jgi:hypothetical protein
MNTSAVDQRVIRGDKEGIHGLRVKLGHPFPDGHKYGNLDLQVREVSNETLT